MVLAPFSYHIFLMRNRNWELTGNRKEAMEMNDGHLSRENIPEVGIASLEDKVFSSEEALVFAGGTKEMLKVGRRFPLCRGKGELRKSRLPFRFG